VRFKISGRMPGAGRLRSPYGSDVSFDAQTGSLLAVNDVRRAGLWTQIEDAMGPLHFGTFGGLPVKILWCLLGLTPGTLAMSGFLIWRARRSRASQSGRREPSALLS
jgi:uncharacterized iron-regulated membrane protein